MAWHKALHCILGYIESLYKIISGEDASVFLFFSLLFFFFLSFLFLPSRDYRKVKGTATHLGRNYLDAFATQLGSRVNDVYGKWWYRS